MAETILDTHFDKSGLANFLGKSERTIERWIALGIGPKRRRVGNRDYFPKDGVNNWLESCDVDGKAA